ncbi:DUF1697 domain-containing protein [Pontimicrobium sp. MEBiC06410]
MKTYIAFLRGINVGGHHKVPMADLKNELQTLGLKNIITILNSGNIIFDSTNKDIAIIEQNITLHLEKTFGFPIPTIVRTAETIQHILKEAPFNNLEITKDIKLYISFLKTAVEPNLQIPWESEDQAYKILDYKNKNIISVLDLSKSKTTKAITTLEHSFGKNITTRNWNTLLRIDKKLNT